MMLSSETELFVMKIRANPWLQDSQLRLAFGVPKCRLLIRCFLRPSMVTDRASQSALSGRKRMAGLNRAFGPLFCSNQLAMLLGVETLDKQSSVLRRARLRYWTCAVVWVTQILPSFDQAERERGRGIREKTMASPSKPSSEALPVQLSPEMVRKCKC